MEKEKTNFVHILKPHDSLMVNPSPSSSPAHIHTKVPKRRGLMDVGSTSHCGHTGIKG